MAMVADRKGSAGGRRRLEARHVSLSYSRAEGTLDVLDDVSLELGEDSFTTILGPNGCGKSSLLRLIAGILGPTSGEILADGRRVEGPHPSRLLMFQRPTLLPWKTVAGNVAFGLRARGEDREVTEKRISDALRLVGLEGFHRSRVWELSGGMQQRVELARALAVEPDLLLMDEPFASLDSLTREVFQEELLRIRRSTSMSFVMVTHDVREAVLLGDEIIILSARPTHVTDVIRPGIPVDERAEWRKTGEFARLCVSVLSKLKTEFARPTSDLDPT